MRLANPFPELALGELFETLLPDFVLAFAFFTALAYAVLGKRFDRQRPAVVMSAVIGLSLSVGLVWWEQQNSLSIRNLGPLAVGFAIIILAGVMYQAIRQVGGSWAGVGIALGASLLVSKLLGIEWFLDPEIIHSAITVALVVGILAFLMHTKGHVIGPVISRRLTLPAVKHNMRDIQKAQRQGYVLSGLLGRRLHGIRQESQLLYQHPELAGDIVHQIKRTLPAEGWLTERMAQLRKKAHQIRNGHIARLEETRKVFAKLPVSAKKVASADLAARYSQLIGIDRRLERLDRTAAANEKRIRELTQQAEKCAQKNDYRKLGDLLKAAEKLQGHNGKIFTIIDRTEAKLTAIAEGVVKEANEVNDA